MTFLNIKKGETFCGYKFIPKPPVLLMNNYYTIAANRQEIP